MSLIKVESDHRSFIDALLSAPRLRSGRSPEALFDQACEQAKSRAEESRRSLDDDMRDGSMVGAVEAEAASPERPIAGRESAVEARGAVIETPGATESESPALTAKPAAKTSPEVANASPQSASKPGGESQASVSAATEIQNAAPIGDAIMTTKATDSANEGGIEIELPPQEARTLGDLAGRLPALEILARRHGEAVARLMAGAMNVGSGLPGDEDLHMRPVDFARWRRDHAHARPFASNASPSTAQATTSAAVDNAFENVFPLRSMGARESVIAAGVANTVQTQTSSTNPVVSQPTTQHAAPVAEAAPAPTGVDVSSRIEKFQAVVSRVANAIVRTADSGGGTAIVRLHPANLGRIQIEVTVEQQVAAVQLAVENPQVRQAMAQDGWLLRESLAQQGLALGAFSVRGDDAGAAQFGRRGDRVPVGERRDARAVRESEIPTAVPRRDLRAARVSLTI